MPKVNTHEIASRPAPGSSAGKASVTRATGARAPAWRADVAVLGVVAGAVGIAWAIARQGWLRSGDDTSYRIAIAGGLMMLAVFLYPLRKHVRALDRLGATRWWLWGHITLGLLGPWLILVHSTFRIGSLNAGVALWSMVIVVLSGIVGRFLHARMHRGLRGERTTLDDLRRRAGLVEDEAVGRLHFAPAVAGMLRRFEQRELAAPAHAVDMLRRIVWLPLRQAALAWQGRRLLRAAVAGEPDPARRARLRRDGGRLVDRYLAAVVRVSQYAAYERLFALWHVAHVPFVVLLVVSAVVHVIAVHAY